MLANGKWNCGLYELRRCWQDKKSIEKGDKQRKSWGSC